MLEVTNAGQEFRPTGKVFKLKPYVYETKSFLKEYFLSRCIHICNHVQQKKWLNVGVCVHSL